MPIERQIEECTASKADRGVGYRRPYTVGPDDKVADARAIMLRFNVNGLPVVTRSGGWSVYLPLEISSSPSIQSLSETV